MKLTNSILLLILFLFISCEDKEMIEKMTALEKENTALNKEVKKLRVLKERINFLAAQLQGVKAKIVTNYGDIELELYPDKAPIHCFNFVTRAEGGFYDNTQFHRVIPTFMIQGGDPNTKTKDKASYGSGGPLVNIPHEFNDMSHGPGVLSMARTSDVRAGAGSQFFIMHGNNPGLDRQYTAFGKVTEGNEVVDKIATTKRTPRDLPLKPVRIKTIEVYR